MPHSSEALSAIVRHSYSWNPSETCPFCTGALRSGSPQLACFTAWLPLPERSSQRADAGARLTPFSLSSHRTRPGIDFAS